MSSALSAPSSPSVRPDPTRKPQRDRHRLRHIGLLVVTVVLTMIGLELALQLALRVRANFFSKSDRYLAILGDAGRAEVYPGWSAAQLRQLLHETYVPVVYEPHTGFAERPRQGRFVNVAAAGYRSIGTSQPWPIDPGALNVFVFGGSTTFGYGVTDSQTIPAAIQDSLGATLCSKSVHVYNFGRGFYYSTQERALFQRFVTAGQRPTAAVFIDGLNDSDNAHDLLPFMDDFARLFGVRQGERGVFASLAVVTATGRVLRRVAEGLAAGDAVADTAPAIGRQAAARWTENVRVLDAAARGLGTLPLFVVQPVRAYAYDFSSHPLAEQAARDPSTLAVRAFYEELEARRDSDPLFRNVLWLADLHQNEEPAHVFVDLGHYTAEFSARMGGEIARSLRARLPGQCGQESS